MGLCQTQKLIEGSKFETTEKKQTTKSVEYEDDVILFKDFIGYRAL